MSQSMKVRIVVETHYHGSLLVPKGTVLELGTATAQHLIGLGVAEPAFASPKFDNSKENDQ